LHVTGVGTLKPPISNTPSTKKLSIGTTASGTSCDHSGVTGGKGPITGVKLKFQLKEPDTGYTCTNYDLGFDTSKLQVTWQGTNPKGRPYTIASDKAAVASFTVQSTNPVTYKTVSTPIAKGAFAGSTITIITALDQDINTLLAQCNGTGIGTFPFGNAHPSTISVP
jgi:hypothetical protein